MVGEEKIWFSRGGRGQGVRELERGIEGLVDHFKVNPASAEELRVILRQATEEVWLSRGLVSSTPLFDVATPRVEESELVPEGIAVVFTRSGRMKELIRLPSHQEVPNDG